MNISMAGAAAAVLGSLLWAGLPAAGAPRMKPTGCTAGSLRGA